MKLKNIAGLAAVAAGIGYLFGSEAGRAQMERARHQADAVLSDPRVQHQVGAMAGRIKDNADRIPSPMVSDAVKSAAERIQTKVTEDEHPGDEHPGDEHPGDDAAGTGGQP